MSDDKSGSGYKADIKCNRCGKNLILIKIMDRDGEEIDSEWVCNYCLSIAHKRDTGIMYA